MKAQLVMALLVCTVQTALAQGNDYAPGNRSFKTSPVTAPTPSIDATSTTNGQLTPFTQKHHGHKEPSAKALARYDKNGDGKLDQNERAEMKAAHEKRKQMMNDPAYQARRQKLIQRFDTNGDGKLDDMEKSAMKTFREEQKARRAARAQ